MNSFKHRPIVLLGSSRKDSNTKRAIAEALQALEYDFIDLREKNINHYEYENTNLDDDFIPIAEQLIRHPVIIFATPVYWYSMSAILKTFIDRFSDLITTHKSIGRSLKGKPCFVVTSYAGTKPPYFDLPFQDLCNYFEMQYQTCLYYYSGKDASLLEQNTSQVNAFSEKLNACIREQALSTEM